MPSSGRAPVKNPGRRLLFALTTVAATGCHSPVAPTTRPTDAYATLSLQSPFEIPSLHADAVPPIGWKAAPLKQSSTHIHEVWLSPDGHTAYGIIYFHLPLPVGRDLALWGFLNQMKQSEGEANLIGKNWDESAQCLRFIAEGGLYKIRANLFVDGFVGWAVYAGTLRAFPVNVDDLATAEIARERTEIGR